MGIGTPDGDSERAPSMIAPRDSLVVVGGSHVTVKLSARVRPAGSGGIVHP